MEENTQNSGLLSHFSGLIRLVIFIVLLAVITFFVVRFIKNRQATKTAEQAGQTAQQKDTDSDTKESKSTKSDTDSSNTEKSTDSNGLSSSSVGVTALPSGVADGGSSTNSTSGTNIKVPAAGMSEDVMATVVMLSLITFLVSKNYVIRKQLLAFE